MAESARYSRQTVLPEMGATGQAKLAAARVLVVGAGGLGCPALLYLAAAGVGTIGIIDFDRIDVSNLQRQVLFVDGDKGKPKASAARARLLMLNQNINIIAYDNELTDNNAMDVLLQYDIIVDGTDNFTAKFLINDTAVTLKKPVVYGAIERFEGQVSVFNYDNGPCYRCLHSQPPETQMMSCAEAGVIGALAGITGTVQAMEAVKLIIGHNSFRSLSGRLWVIDARVMESTIIRVLRRKDCSACSIPAENIILRHSPRICVSGKIREISPHGKIPGDALFIDVRGSGEWSAGHIASARHVPLTVLQKQPDILLPLGKGRCCIVYCQQGTRSRQAAEILLQAGHENVYSLKGGYDGWCSSDKHV